VVRTNHQRLAISEAGPCWAGNLHSTTFFAARSPGPVRDTTQARRPCVRGSVVRLRHRHTGSSTTLACSPVTPRQQLSSRGGNKEATVSSKQTAAPGTSSSFNMPMRPALHVQTAAPAPEQVPHPYSPTVQQRSGTRILKLSCIVRSFQPNEPAGNSGNHAPRLTPDLQLPRALAEDPGESAGPRTFPAFRE
jgi:hypothetical protein